MMWMRSLRLHCQRQTDRFQRGWKRHGAKPDETPCQMGPLGLGSGLRSETQNGKFRLICEVAVWLLTLTNS